MKTLIIITFALISAVIVLHMTRHDMALALLTAGFCVANLGYVASGTMED